jgi:hypothetical protein
MPLKEDSQSGMFDRTIENPELEDLIEKRIENHESAKAFTAAQRGIKKIIDTLELKDGERVRCGAYVWTSKARQGGGFEMPEWESVGISDLQTIG